MRPRLPQLAAQPRLVKGPAYGAEAIAATGAESMRDMGKLMGVLKPKLQGRADMGGVSQRVKARLGS